ncbi:molybdenum cofactor guanylyltransferase MobA [Acidovorax sp. MR-S7]|uniref:molybdenum cofactor guanylyltransferase MobA n=1 Tax=Acidovorax sp. MR-S7 TaxID=1268622 RepID=UPI000376AA0A|nr:molybdenum cofactor guanylyltransferase MobA [Acidovorax sp. MR-S7]GAD23993.1 molybdopterin-guanine dinucleotide biosynthesis protein A [Acidovorax sp. MR-S7]
MTIPAHDITGLVLAGGRGTRMGGVDKGLQPFRGTLLALHALRRLQPQVGAVALNANRHLAEYAAFGTPVWPDTLAGHPGPLAGFVAGLERCGTPWLLTVPCDTPLFPPDLAARLAQAAARTGAGAVLAADAGGLPQPVFCLLRAALLPDLRQFVAGGGRKVRQWAARHGGTLAAFDQPGDDPRAFDNANTLAELHALEHP